MKAQRWQPLLVTLVLVITGLWLLLTSVSAVPSGTVSGLVLSTVEGVVVDADGPVAGAVVRQQTTTTSTISAADGTFTLGGLPEGITVTVTAWHEGYHPGGVEVVPSQTGVTITLKRHPTGDNPDYEWLTSMPDPESPIGCGHCMAACPAQAVTVEGLDYADFADMPPAPAPDGTRRPRPRCRSGGRP